VTKREISRRPRLQNLPSMFKIKVIVKTANEAIAEILKDEDLNLTAINHLTYAAATVITEEVNRTGCYQSENHSL
jgi:hypothetical protein